MGKRKGSVDPIWEGLGHTVGGMTAAWVGSAAAVLGIPGGSGPRTTCRRRRSGRSAGRRILQGARGRRGEEGEMNPKVKSADWAGRAGQQRPAARAHSERRTQHGGRRTQAGAVHGGWAPTVVEAVLIDGRVAARAAPAAAVAGHAAVVPSGVPALPGRGRQQEAAEGGSRLEKRGWRQGRRAPHAQRWTRMHARACAAAATRRSA